MVSLISRVRAALLVAPGPVVGSVVGSLVGSLMASFCRGQRSHGPVGRRDHGWDPDAVVRRAADRQSGDRRHRVTDARDPVEMAHGVLREAASPALDVRVDRLRTETGGGAEVAEGSGD